MIKGVGDLEIYRVFVRVPKTEFDISSNCKRAAKSIPANLAEGFAKRSSAAAVLSKRLNSLQKNWKYAD